MALALSWLREHACAPIRYRVARDLLAEAPPPALRAAVRADPGARAIAAAQGADGTWDGRLHTAAVTRPHLCTAACLRRLLDLGWDRSDPAVARALESPHLLGRPLDGSVPARDTLAGGGAPDIRAALLAEAGCAGAPAVQAYAATAAEGLLATCHAWARGRVLWEDRGHHQILSHAVVWPTVYHLRLLAHAPPPVRAVARPAAALALDQPPPPGLRVEADGGLYAPATAAYSCLHAPDPWVRLEALTLAVRAGWAVARPDLVAAAHWFLARAGDGGRVSLPGRHPHFSSQMPGALEPDWRRPERRQADWTFRVELLRAALAGNRD